MEKRFLTGCLLLSISILALPKESYAQNVGIGTTTPKARLQVADSAVLFNAVNDIPATAGNPPQQGVGRRMMWYPDKAAFRVGYAVGTEWNKTNIGNYSFASGSQTLASGTSSTAMGTIITASGDYSTGMGYYITASGIGSVAMGYQASATGSYATALGLQASAGDYSTAIGPLTIASGNGSTALGYQTTASGSYATAFGHLTIANVNTATAMGSGTMASGTSSTAMGDGTTASGTFSTAMGDGTTASGASSTAMGNNSIASGTNSIAMGVGATANGNNSIAMGTNVSTSGFVGAFIIGDASTPTIMPSFVANGFRSRFAGGYRLLTNSAASIGVVLLPDDNSWGAISDVRLKENFEPVNGEIFLKKISDMPLSSWNYKVQDPKRFRHYGPMAQDFYAAFGKDGYGTIGCDTLINQQDFLGVNLIAIQALEKRTQKIEQLEKENADIKKENELLIKRIEKIEAMLKLH
ncbi:MAG: tail fiber domain-containing protein [Ferruginibacter sp.]